MNTKTPNTLYEETYKIFTHIWESAIETTSHLHNRSRSHTEKLSRQDALMLIRVAELDYVREWQEISKTL